MHYVPESVVVSSALRFWWVVSRDPIYDSCPRLFRFRVPPGFPPFFASFFGGCGYLDSTNAPSLKPTISSEIWIGCHSLPLWTAISIPTHSGMIVERRVPFGGLPGISGSWKGPFHKERTIIIAVARIVVKNSSHLTTHTHTPTRGKRTLPLLLPAQNAKNPPCPDDLIRLRPNFHPCPTRTCPMSHIPGWGPICNCSIE